MDEYEVEQIVFQYVETVSKKSKYSRDAVKDILFQYLEKFINVEIICSSPLDEEQMNSLYSFNDFCAYQALYNKEVLQDIRKLTYVANNTMRKALIAIGLTSSMLTSQRRNNETKEFYEQNLTIHQSKDAIKYIDFGNINPQRFTDIINPEIIEDCKVYFDVKGFGISSLLDYKMHLNGLEDFVSGGDDVYEFARFQRKYHELANRKTSNARDSAQEAFRNSMVNSIANKFTEQQMLEGKSMQEMMLMVEDLFTPQQPSYTKPKKRTQLPKKNGETKRIAAPKK
ncbi:MAG: hypothetical protein R3Y43_05065 [Alphaproteobacteria bacterium]